MLGAAPRRVGPGHLLATALFALLCALAAAPPAGAGQSPAWEGAADVRALLGDAEKALLLDGPEPARRLVAAAGRAYAGGLRGALRAEWPRLAATLERSLHAADRAAAADDPAAFATARAAAWTAVLGATYRGARTAAARGDARSADGWLLVREYRPPTRLSRAGADATLAVAALATGRASPAQAAAAVRADLLDTYQGRLRLALEQFAPAARSGFDARAAQAAALARGYWEILADAFAAERGAGARARATAAFDRLTASAGGGGAGAGAQVAAVTARLEGFRAVPLPAEEAVRRAGQLRRFVKLVPVEYGRGVRDGRVALDFEIQEAVTFRDGAGAAFDDLESALLRRDPGRTREMGAELAALRADLAEAVDGSRVADPSAVRARAERVLSLSDEAFPGAWTSAGAGADFDVIDATLDRLQAAAAARDFGQAEQARLEAYAIFEFGPEQRLRGLAQDLFVRVEGLFWYGDGDRPGLVQLIERRAEAQEIAATRAALDGALAEAARAVGDGPKSLGTVVGNTAIIVFREGLEAVLILAALMGSMRGDQRSQRRPMWVGVGLAVAATAITWAIAQTVLSSLNRYGEKLEAVVSLVAIAVLLLILNWFFHRVYWTGHLSHLHGRKRGVLGRRGASSPPSSSDWPRSASPASTARASRPCCSCSRSCWRWACPRCSSAPPWVSPRPSSWASPPSPCSGGCRTSGCSC